MIPMYWNIGLLIIYRYFCSCVYMETGTSRLTETPVEATEILGQAGRTNFVHINAISPGTPRG